MFGIRITPPELGALMAYFDKEGEGVINCAEFLVQFFRTGVEERARRSQLWRRYDEKMIEKRRQAQLQKEQELEAKTNAKVQTDFTEEDFQSGISKLTEAAIKHDRNSTSAVGLGSFECESMPPLVFKEQLKRVFNIVLTPRELGALMAYFDKEDTGVINCAEFLIQFFRTGLEERNRLRALTLDMQRRKELKDNEIKEQKRLEILRKEATCVDFDFTEAEFDSGLARFITMCFRLDRRQFGSTTLKAFQVDQLKPSEFRELLKRTFNLKLNPPELGALVTLFDPKQTGFVSCPAFLHTFTQTRLRMETIKVRPV